MYTQVAGKEIPNADESVKTFVVVHQIRSQIRNEEMVTVRVGQLR